MNLLSMKTDELRQIFLNYFKEQGHTLVPSSALVPSNDPTLLFTNAGMVQFKDIFLGKENPRYSRAASVQRCVRAGGKHNDLENVGYTTRHHTFFEMLGNFSFGDYFKEEAIVFAWNFLIHTLKIPSERLWISVFDKDEEAFNIWSKKIKFPEARISRCDEKDNFWMMGNTGPCGPCSEIFYDHGKGIAGGPPGTPEAGGDRYTEIWNMVFMQYERLEDGSQKLLPKPSVDTGMGLERIAAVMQNVYDNYDIDIFVDLLRAVAELTNVVDTKNKSLRVLADHIRSSSFLIADGVFPSNEGRGYVLRRILRRALRHLHKLNIHEPCFYRLTPKLIEIMGEAYPELKNKKSVIENILHQEETQFLGTLERGLAILEAEIPLVKNNTLPGELIFKLYDTYGFPVDLTGDIAREFKLNLDLDGFEKKMAKQRERSQQTSSFTADFTQLIKIEQATQFVGYRSLHENNALIIALFKDNQPSSSLEAGEAGWIVLDRTPFYAESGGQIGDKGYLKMLSGQFEVTDTIKSGHTHLHRGWMRQGSFSVNERVSAEVTSVEREAIKRNHSATHLLHAALKKILGESIQQKGSLVNAESLRFDFSFPRALTTLEWKAVEQAVNEKILENMPAEISEMPIEEAKKMGAMALFDEKYGDRVRVIQLGDFSTELCAGTHVDRTGDIGAFILLEETGIAANIRRISAITGEAVLVWIQKQRDHQRQLDIQLQTKDLSAQLERIQTLQNKLKILEKKEIQFIIDRHVEHLIKRHYEIKNAKLIVEQFDGEPSQLALIVDRLKARLKTAVIILAVVKGEKIALGMGVTADLTYNIKAHEILKTLAEKLGGQGGGRAEWAQGGGIFLDQLGSSLETVKLMLADRIQ